MTEWMDIASKLLIFWEENYKNFKKSRMKKSKKKLKIKLSWEDHVRIRKKKIVYGSLANPKE